MAEQWKDLMGYEGYYQVSNHGKVKSLDRIIHDGKPGERKIKGGVMRLNVVGTGYITVSLYQPDIQRCNEYVHKLVLLMFEGFPPTTEHECNHKDGNKQNNHISNLEWVTKSENNRHAFNVLGRKAISNPGEANGNSKLTEGNVLEIRELYSTGDYRQQELGEMFNISSRHISEIICRKYWRHIP